MSEAFGQTRKLLVHTLYPKGTTDQLGFLHPLAEIVDGKLESIDAENFCPTMKVFITSHYEELAKSFPDQKLFEIDVRVTTQTSENVNPELACKYVATYQDARAIRPKDFYEVIVGQLPDANDRRMAISDLPGTSYIFVEDAGSAYGPFKWASVSAEADVISIRLEFVDAPLPGVKLMPYQIYEVSVSEPVESLFVLEEERLKKKIFQGLGAIQSAKFYDYASNDELVRYCARLASDSNAKIVEKSKFDSLIALLRKNPKLDASFVKGRLQRLSDVVKMTNDTQIAVAEEVSGFLSGVAGREIVETFIQKNEARLLAQFKEEREAKIELLLKDRLAEIKASEERVKDLQKEKVKLSDEVESLMEKTKRESSLDVAYANADAQIKEKSKKIEALDSEIVQKSKHFEILSTVEAIDLKLSAMKAQERGAWKEQEKLKQEIADLQSEFLKHDDALRKRLTELRPFVEAINGAFSTDQSQPSEISVKTKDIKSNEPRVVRQRNVIGAIKTALEGRGRNLPDWQIANLLICTQQSFLTVLAGLPGVGKTSLARLLCEVQNISSRMQEVAVARGWTSQKDLIGFHNPLTSRFQSSNTGMYSFLSALIEEKEPTSAMAYVLLDEANLSPIEHYWSSFMGMTDSLGEGKIFLGQDQIRVPQNLRFLATINYDGTTEPLSPRVVDRAPIIVLTPDDEEAFAVDPCEENIDIQLPLSADLMSELFGNATSVPELLPGERKLFETVRHVLSTNSDASWGRGISISPRKDLAVRQYCDKARGIMNAERDTLALDVAMLQLILPLVRGSGNRFAKRLGALRDELSTGDLTRSAQYVERMMIFGESELHSYDFFCW